MCYTDPRTTMRIKEVISVMVGRKKRFTGHDIATVINATAAHPFSARDISTKVRELFNGHDACFAGYACYPVVGGPLLYFYAGVDVMRRGQTILDTIAFTAPSTL